MLYERACAIWCHLYILKKVKNTHGVVVKNTHELSERPEQFKLAHLTSRLAVTVLKMHPQKNETKIITHRNYKNFDNRIIHEEVENEPYKQGSSAKKC